jgi:hypothetical protein
MLTQKQMLKKKISRNTAARESHGKMPTFSFLYLSFISFLAAMLNAVSAARDSPPENHEQSSKVSVLEERKAV